MGYAGRVVDVKPPDLLVRRRARPGRQLGVVAGSPWRPSSGCRRNRLVDAILAWLSDDRDHKLEDLNRFQVYVSNAGDTRIEPYGDRFTRQDHADYRRG